MSQVSLRRIVPSLLCAAMVAAILEGILDLILLDPLAPEAWGGAGGALAGSGYLLALSAMGGACMGAALVILTLPAILLGRRHVVTWRNPGILLASGVFFTLLVVANRDTFEGPWIRHHPHRIAIQAMFLLLSFAAILGGTRLMAALGLSASGEGRRRAEAWYPALMILGSLALYLADSRLYRGLYPQIHLQLAVTSWLLLTAALVVLQGWAHGRHLKLVAAALLIALPGGALLRSCEALPVARARIVRRSVNIKQWMSLPEALLDALAALPMPAAADVGDITAALTTNDETNRRVHMELDRRVPKRRELNLLVISADNMRADHLGNRAVGRSVTPNLDRLARDAIVFERCYSQHPSSAWAYSGFFTGRYASCTPYAWEVRHESPAWPDDLTLAGLLAKAGFATAAEVAFSENLLSDRALFGHLKDGFQVFTPKPAPGSRMRGAREVTRNALERLDEMRGRRFLLWLHYLDPHEPHEKDPHFDFGDSTKEHYLSEVALVDAQVGRILTHLEEQGALERTIVLIMSDHGTAFGEHGAQGHGSTLYEEQIRVPLVIRVPGFGSARVSGAVGLCDALPTLLELLDVPDPHPRNGRSLWPPILGLGDWTHLAYAELYPRTHGDLASQEAVVLGDSKLIVQAGTRTEELYDLAADPGEVRNLAAAEPKRASRMRGLLAHLRGRVAAIRGTHGDDGPRTAPGPQALLESLLDNLEAAPPEQRRNRLKEFLMELRFASLTLDGGFLDLLRTTYRARAGAILRKIYDDRDPLFAREVLALGTVLGDPEMLALARSVRSSNPLIVSEAAVLRGMLGDRSVIDTLKLSLCIPSSPRKERASMALIHLREPHDPVHALAVCRTEQPLVIARVLEGLAAMGAPELEDLVEEMLGHRYWRPWCVVRALARGLVNRPPSPWRDRTLARLRALDVPGLESRIHPYLAASRSENRLAALLRAGRSEQAGDLAMKENRLEDAAASYRQASTSYHAPAPALAIKLARVLELKGDLQAARNALEQAGRATDSETWRRRLHIAANAVAGPRRFAPRAIHLGVRKTMVAPRSLRGQWNLVQVEVRNEGRLTWPGGVGAGSLAFQVVVLTPDGVVVPRHPAFDGLLSPQDIPPGGTCVLKIPLYATPPAGRYQLAIRPVFTTPRGARTVGSQRIPLGTSVEIAHDL